MLHLSVIIPAYNEEKRIEKTLLSVDGHLSKQSYDYEILVVNDGSKDKTAEIVNGVN
jgi:glycosyltransferase involved in cell wall biosynthesis